MWEQYGDNHRGVCLAFDRRALIEGEFRRALQEIGGTNIGEVDYTAGGFAADPARVLADIPDDENASRAIFEHLETHNAAFWFLKLLDWETEYEFRIVLMPGPVIGEDPVFVPFGSCLKAVILGERFEQARIADAAELAERLRVPLVRLEWSGGRPSVEPI